MPSVSERSVDEWTYVVTDVELDGPWPGVNSMRSFASVGGDGSGREDPGVVPGVPGSVGGRHDGPRARPGRDGEVRRLAQGAAVAADVRR